MTEIKDMRYPKTEVFVVLGQKTYPLYTTAEPNFLRDLLNGANDSKIVSFDVAVKKHEGGLWYMGVGQKPNWNTWTVKKDNIQAFVELPKPKVSFDYDYGDKDDEEDYDF